MKKILLYSYIIILLIGYINQSVLGQTASSTPEISVSPISTQNKAIENLKEKIANKVAEIRKKNTRAVAGKLIDTSSEGLKIKNNDNEEYQIKLDDALTKYYRITGSSQKEIKKENLERDDYLIVSGVINDKVVTANSVFVDQSYIVDSGKITEVDKEKYNLTVLTADKSIYKLSIENSTKQQIINIKTLDLEKTGFSKIIAGDSIHFAVKNITDKDGFYAAEKILIVPQEYFMK